MTLHKIQVRTDGVKCSCGFSINTITGANAFRLAHHHKKIMEEKGLSAEINDLRGA